MAQAHVHQVHDWCQEHWVHQPEPCCRFQVPQPVLKGLARAADSCSHYLGLHDSVLMFSIDGAQPYEKKQSDCWIYIWVLFTLNLELRYKKAHILPGVIIHGPNNPKNLKSFLFPGLYHLAALRWLPSLSKVENIIPAPVLIILGVIPKWCSPAASQWGRKGIQLQFFYALIRAG